MKKPAEMIPEISQAEYKDECSNNYCLSKLRLLKNYVSPKADPIEKKLTIKSQI